MLNLFKTCKVYFYSKELKKKKLLKEFHSKAEAKKFIKLHIKRDIQEGLDFATSKNQLLSLSSSNQYYINNKHFYPKKYIEKIAKELYKESLSDLINENYTLNKDQGIKKLLEDIQGCEVINVTNLQDEICINYIKNGERKYLTIKDKHYSDSYSGIARGFEFYDKPLEELKLEKKYNENKRQFQTIEHYKQIDSRFKDIYFVTKIFYLESKTRFKTLVKLEIIYETKQSNSNSYQLYFKNGELSIKQYKDIFNYSSQFLQADQRKDLKLTYTDRHFDASHKELLKKVIKTFGKKIKFYFDEKSGVSVKNLFDQTKVQMIDQSIFCSLSKVKQDELLHFFSIAALYLNDLFINKELDNIYIYKTFLKSSYKTKVKALFKNLEEKGFEKELYYESTEEKKLSKRVYLYSYNLDQTKQFVLLKQIDQTYYKLTLKYNNNLKNLLENQIDISK